MKRVLFYSLVLFTFSIFVSPSFAQEYITLGIPTSLKLPTGDEAHKSVRLAVEEINAKGGLQVENKKMLFKVEALDTRDAEPGVPIQEALLGVEKLILDKKIYASVVGNFRSEALLAAMDIYSKYKIINIATIAMTPKFQEKIMSDKERYKYSFRNCLDSNYLFQYMQSMMTSIQQQFGYSKVFIAVQDVLWATTTGSLMEKWFKDNGWAVLGFEKFPTGATDFSSLLIKAKTTKSQIIMPLFDMPPSAILMKQWRSMKVPALIAGFMDPLMGPDAWKVFGDINGSLNVVFEIGYFPIKAYPPTVKFTEAYARRWKGEIQSARGSGPSYDAVYVLANAIEKAGTLDTDKVAKAIEDTDMPGVVGRINFDKGHQLIFGNDPKTAACGGVFQWQKNKRVVVWPESLASGKIEKPSWVK